MSLDSDPGVQPTPQLQCGRKSCCTLQMPLPTPSCLCSSSRACQSIHQCASLHSMLQRRNAAVGVLATLQQRLCRNMPCSCDHCKHGRGCDWGWSYADRPTLCSGNGSKAPAAMPHHPSHTSRSPPHQRAAPGGALTATSRTLRFGAQLYIAHMADPTSVERFGHTVMPSSVFVSHRL